MQIQHIGYRVKGFYRQCFYGQRHSMEATSITIPHRLKILRFWERHGISATLEAFGISRRTLYTWKKTLAEQGANALENRSRAPAARRRRRWPPTIIQHIRRLRQQMPNLGKEQLFVLLKPWCGQRALACPSTSTIGRLIRDADDRMRVTPPALTPKGKLKTYKKTEA